MADRTITALYPTKADAQLARDDLKAAGFDHGIDIHDQTTGATEAEGGFMGRLKSFFGDHEDSQAYGEGLRRGHFLLTAKVDDEDADDVAKILEGSNAVDFDQTQAGWRTEGWATTAAPLAAAPATTPKYGDEQTITLAEEQLRVGKREVERGGVRVRSYVVETPVSESISLHEERVSIERRPTDRVVAANEALFQPKTIELTETAEEAVVAKDTIVRDELIVKKEGFDRVETIEDKVRRTEVEVEDTTVRGGAATTTPRI